MNRGLVVRALLARGHQLELDRLNRRNVVALLGGAAAAWPFAARAQRNDGMRRIGILMGAAESDPETQSNLGAFRQTLRELGWTEGRNIGFEYRMAAASGDRQLVCRSAVGKLPPRMMQRWITMGRP